MNKSIQTSIETPKKVGLTLFFVVFIVFGGWSALAPIEGAAIASGVVRVGTYSKVVQHLEGGIVGEIKVRNGDFVKEGDALVILDDTQSQAELEIARTRYASLNVIAARLLAERDRRNEFSIPADDSVAEINVESEVNAQQAIFIARRAANASSAAVLERQIDQLQERITGLEALKNSKEELASSFESELKDVRTLLDQGFTDKITLRELERNIATYRGEAADLLANISSARVQIAETELEILQEQNEFHNKIVVELGEVQTQLRAVVERINANEDIVKRKIIRAPSDGIVNKMQFHTTGGVIGAGSMIAEIVPQHEELVIETKVSTSDIDRIAIGQDASVRFSAFGNSVPTVKGSVTSLSADALASDDFSPSYYLATVEVNPSTLDTLGNLELLPGMPSDVFIATGSRTFIQYLFKPLSNGLARSFSED